jgi:uncharacterized hydrophobic protein (TIGR00271 family)
MRLSWPQLVFKFHFSRVSAAASRELSSALVDEARLSGSFVALTLGSSAIATFGLLENSAAVIIGAMIIAPLLAPIQALAYGVLDGSVRNVRASCISLTAGSVLAVGVSALLARAIGLTIFGSEVMSRTRPNLLDLGIAIAAGLVGGFARTRPGISNTVAGTAIAVALMPPLCVLGIGLAAGDYRIATGALLLFVTNLFGITLASTVIFFLAGYATRHVGSALFWTIGLTAALVIPLTLSFGTLVHEDRLESALRLALTKHTVTFHDASLVSSAVDWSTTPPAATLLVRGDVPITPHQVGLLEAFALQTTRQHFRLIIFEDHEERVTATGVGQQPAATVSP